MFHVENHLEMHALDPEMSLFENSWVFFKVKPT